MNVNRLSQSFENQQFDLARDDDSSAVFEGFKFATCKFDNCVLSNTKVPGRRSTVRSAQLANCIDNGSLIGPAVIEETVVENCDWLGVLQIFGAVYKHVTLRGTLGDLMINNECLPDIWVDKAQQYRHVEAFREANVEYYRHVDWALDISRGEFKDLDIRGIPSRLIRRDPETQVVISRQRLLEVEDWKSLKFQVAPCRATFQLLFDFEFEDLIVVAPKRNPRFREYLGDLQLLRDSGVAEPD